MTTGLTIAERARRRYNAVGDTFFSNEEMFDYIHQAQKELAQYAMCLKRAYTTVSVAAQQAYAFPTNAFSIYRVTYNGEMLHQTTMREDDVITLSNQSTPDTGTPAYFYTWGQEFFLRPIPASAGDTIKLWSYDLPQAVTATGSVDIAAEYEDDLLYFVLSQMAMKQREFQISDKYMTLWEMRKAKARATEARRKRGNGPAYVQDIDTLAMSGMGHV